MDSPAKLVSFFLPLSCPMSRSRCPPGPYLLGSNRGELDCGLWHSREINHRTQFSQLRKSKQEWYIRIWKSMKSNSSLLSGDVDVNPLLMLHHNRGIRIDTLQQLVGLLQSCLTSKLVNSSNALSPPQPINAAVSTTHIPAGTVS